MKYYLTVGERSGDLHASNLMKAIQKEDPNAEFRFLGGELMEAVGGERVMHYNEVSIMGFTGILKHLRRLFRNFKLIKNDILQFRPDVLIPVDFGAFNLRMAKHINPKSIRVFYYITPKIWAWNTKRVEKVKKYIERMFVILPFEKDFYKKHGYNADFVGNPLTDSVFGHLKNINFREENKLDDRPIIALLPGSRKQELKHKIPLMVSAAERFKECQFVLAGISTFPENFYKNLIGDADVKLVFDQTYDALLHAEAALVTSGTATLETALFNVPQVVCYKAGELNYRIAKNVVKVNYISLVNLITGEETVKELIQKEFTKENLEKELQDILTDSRREKILKGYEKIKHLIGPAGCSAKAAKLIVTSLD